MPSFGPYMVSWTRTATVRGKGGLGVESGDAIVPSEIFYKNTMIQEWMAFFRKCDGYCPLKFTEMCRWLRLIKTTNVEWLYYDCTRWCMIIVKARWREDSTFNHTWNCTLSTTGGSCSNVHVHADNTRKIPIPSCLLGVNGSSPWIWHMTIVNLQRSVKAKDSYHKLRWFVILRFS